MNFDNTERVIEKFKIENKDRIVDTLNPVIKLINPQKIIAINDTYTYPEIMKDYRMERLIELVELNGWQKINIQGFCLLEFPNGDLVVNGNGNHRAVLSKSMRLEEVSAFVYQVVYLD